MGLLTIHAHIAWEDHRELSSHLYPGFPFITKRSLKQVSCCGKLCYIANTLWSFLTSEGHSSRYATRYTTWCLFSHAPGYQKQWRLSCSYIFQLKLRVQSSQSSCNRTGCAQWSFHSIYCLDCQFSMFHDQTTVRGMPNSTKRLKLRVDVNLNF